LIVAVVNPGFAEEGEDPFDNSSSSPISSPLPINEEVPDVVLEKNATTIDDDEDAGGESLFTQCLLTVKAFARGGRPGQEVLKRVLPGIFKKYYITDYKERRRILVDAGLTPSHDSFFVTKGF
jgi:hypothetical protein